MKYADVTVGEMYRAQIEGAQTLVKVVRVTERDGRKVFAVVPDKGGAETTLSAAALHQPNPAAAKAPAKAPDPLGQIAGLLRGAAGRVERAALLRDLAAHGRTRAGKDELGMAAAELRPIEERARKLLTTFSADIEQALRLAATVGLMRELPKPEAQPVATPVPATERQPDAAQAPAEQPAEGEAAQPPGAAAEPAVAAQPAAAKVRLLKQGKQK